MILMASNRLHQPTRVSLVLFPLHHQALWRLRFSAGMVSSSQVLRRLIRQVTSVDLASMQDHFATLDSKENVGKQGRLKRATVLLDTGDLDKLDCIALQAQAPSRSAATRFLILHANSDGGRT